MRKELAIIASAAVLSLSTGCSIKAPNMFLLSIPVTTETTPSGKDSNPHYGSCPSARSPHRYQSLESTYSPSVNHR